MTEATTTAERADLQALLDTRRFFLRHTTRDLTDEQVNTRTTASALTLISLVKHVADTEAGWVAFIRAGAAAMDASTGWNGDDPEAAGWEPPPGDPRFVVRPGLTLTALLDHYADVAADTARVLGEVDLDETHPLPVAPWFEPGASWSNRRVLLHLIGETAQHAGHADIIRESLDGALSMG